jgi:predicted RNase H-like nuclease (RuvC/YqgF family)
MSTNDKKFIDNIEHLQAILKNVYVNIDKSYYEHFESDKIASDTHIDFLEETIKKLQEKLKEEKKRCQLM